ncbi:transglutaminase family protein [Vannielia sp.]|uniref:transglutaminase family protein n=1 Tax=Vannielia sp. TaxID=2813045 RepID=UPI002633205E|nr:transglutaminase family protein [Vannielia sp.]MDF1872326.1 transglutaminase family protein [Vannielia sp.]
MRLKIRHVTKYSFTEPVVYGLEQLRKTPKSHRAQTVLNWKTKVAGGEKELQYEDHHRNVVELISIAPGATELILSSEGEVEMQDASGVTGPHEGPAPVWLFERSTPLTRVGPKVRDLARGVAGKEGLDQLHALLGAVHEAVKYQINTSEPDWTAERALEEGCGVCQDQAHVFIAAARHLKHPARYVSGYLKLDDRTDQDAMHGWAEAHVDGLGWVGFDVSNKVSPDTRYVRVATGLDYGDAAPVTGTRIGGEGEVLTVELDISQQ